MKKLIIPIMVVLGLLFLTGFANATDCTRFNVTNDTYIDSRGKTSNYNNRADIWLYNWDFNTIGYFKIDISAIPANKIIKNATLNGVYYLWQSQAVQIYDNLGDWSELTLTWNNAPPYNASYYWTVTPAFATTAGVWTAYTKTLPTSMVQKYYESGKMINWRWYAPSPPPNYPAIHFTKRESGSPQYVVVCYDDAIQHEVKSSIIAPSDYYLEENNTVILTANVTGTGFNITYNDNGGSNAYLTFNSTTEQITKPFNRRYELGTGIYNFTFNINPYNESLWNGFIMTVTDKPDNSTDTYSYYYPNITIGYREALYDWTIDYPSINYVGENNTIKLKATKNPRYTYPKPNVTVKYKNALSRIFYCDPTCVEVTSPYEKTYVGLWEDKDINITVYPYTNFTTFEINGSYETIYTPEITSDFNKSNQLPPEDPDYIEIRYRYSPITYPYTGRQMTLQFHHFSGNWEQWTTMYDDCTYDGNLNVWTCPTTDLQNFANNVTVACRNCEENASKQLIQYWTNETDCNWFNDTLWALKYWGYDVFHMISLDKDVCNNTGIVTSVFPDLTLRGSLKSFDKRDKYIYINTSVNQTYQILEYGDTLGLDIQFSDATKKTTAKDRDSTSWAETSAIYINDFQLVGKRITFFIDSVSPKTIWVDKIIISNHMNYEILRNLQGLYTSHSGKNIAVTPSYDLITDTVAITTANPKEKIPIEPAVGSNELLLYGLETPMTDMLSDTGSGLGGFLDLIRNPLVTIVLAIGVIVGILTIFYAVATVIQKAIGGIGSGS